MNTNELYTLWKNKATEDKDLIDELVSIEGNEEEIYDRFYRALEFGTAGLRGVIGAGTNRMNIYSVRLATQGLANYLNNKYSQSAVAISYDSRIKADLFAKEAARVLAGNGIKVFISTELQPTPVLSFLVRELKCSSGIMITASHNPAKYNGYKCYGSDGCQMTDDGANAVYSEIQKLDCFEDIKLADFDKALADGTIEYVADSVYETYLDNVQAQQIHKDICKDSDLKVVYTPLNGAGNKLVRKILDRIGVKDVQVVKEQEMPDGNFTTCPYPNPEFKEALKLGLDMCNEVKPDLLLATDPDSDRVGIAAKDGDSYRLITGNETGIMLTDYVLSQRKALGTLPENPIVVKTIVTSIMINKLCSEYGAELRNVLTGFKYIGEQILGLEQKGEERRYVFGFEESYGYLAGSYVRDKDAVVASMLICEMAAFYKKQGKTLSQVIDEMYEKHGYYMNNTLNFAFEGAEGMKKMSEIMTGLRENAPSDIAGFKIIKVDDYLNSVSEDILTREKTEIKLPKSNVIAYSLEGENAVIVRPSGTEPKIKLYVTAVGKTSENAKELLNKLAKAGEALMGV
ncbi:MULTISPECIES: phospho-sugar mutase [unclassified Ruminococcus]|uniref:phospho-sugar mutase n=1 Tax=unclassified Ruminococcus TaxID=2608920 RepID=UPI00210DEA98|nr:MULTISPECIES: phospho-sugar mutase [unclassified Ruminococcus]MCQ4021649.1 phospho-sugar mutase [Ruminococcus sp. zg-924]MCQ4114094.1 phospho-sugar mutase [Ruminococcus sp. zg-921]